jgi:hypothetical protein
MRLAVQAYRRIAQDFWAFEAMMVCMEHWMLHALRDLYESSDVVAVDILEVVATAGGRATLHLGDEWIELCGVVLLHHQRIAAVVTAVLNCFTSPLVTVNRKVLATLLPVVCKCIVHHARDMTVIKPAIHFALDVSEPPPEDGTVLQVIAETACDHVLDGVCTYFSRLDVDFGKTKAVDIVDMFARVFCRFPGLMCCSVDHTAVFARVAAMTPAALGRFVEFFSGHDEWMGDHRGCIMEALESSEKNGEWTRCVQTLLPKVAGYRGPEMYRHLKSIVQLAFEVPEAVDGTVLQCILDALGQESTEDQLNMDKMSMEVVERACTTPSLAAQALQLSNLMEVRSVLCGRASKDRVLAASCIAVLKKFVTATDQFLSAANKVLVKPIVAIANKAPKFDIGD